MFTYLKMEQKKTNQELNKKSQTGLTPIQKLFVLLCRRVGLPTEKMAIILDIFSEKELREVIEWSMEMVKSNGEVKLQELTAKISQMVLEKKE